MSAIRNTRLGKPSALTIMMLLRGQRIFGQRGAQISIGSFCGKLLKFSS
jgi:hypothetical protein